jgi:hypothetical protein
LIGGDPSIISMGKLDMRLRVTFSGIRCPYMECR